MTPRHLAIILQLSGCFNLALGLAGMLFTPSLTLTQGAILFSVGMFGFMLGRLWLWMLNRRDKQLAQQYAQRLMQLGRANGATVLGPGLIRPPFQPTIPSVATKANPDKVVPMVGLPPSPPEGKPIKGGALLDFTRQGSVMADEPDQAIEVKRISGLDAN
jgi:hypothetical protein